MVSIFVPHPERLNPNERERVRERYNRYLDDQTAALIISGACMVGWTVIWAECEPAMDKMLFDLGVGYLGIILLTIWFCYGIANEMKDDLNYLKQRGAIRFSDDPERTTGFLDRTEPKGNKEAKETAFILNPNP